MTSFRKVNDEVFYVTQHPVVVGPESVAFLKENALQSPRQRARLCAHPDTQHALHEMLIVMHGNAYVPPHRHSIKAESLFVLEGEADAVFFNDDGSVQQVIRLSPQHGGGTFFYRIDQPVYHSLLFRSEWFVYVEATMGPFSAQGMELAPWAPPEADQAAALAYMENLNRLVAKAG